VTGLLLSYIRLNCTVKGGGDDYGRAGRERQQENVRLSGNDSELYSRSSRFESQREQRLS
jgi:hypothetical protein